MTKETSGVPSSAEPKRQGLVWVFTGEGKGKTSAALGAVIRALGHGLRVYIGFFIKGNFPSGERNILAKLPNVTMEGFGTGRLVDPKNPKAADREEVRRGLEAARRALQSGNYDLVVLDEINVAVSLGLIGVEEVLGLIAQKPAGVELILTGRGADSRLIKSADLVTEMLKIKHPYDEGIRARKGIEY